MYWAQGTRKSTLMPVCNKNWVGSKGETVDSEPMMITGETIGISTIMLDYSVEISSSEIPPGVPVGVREFSWSSGIKTVLHVTWNHFISGYALHHLCLSWAVGFHSASNRLVRSYGKRKHVFSFSFVTESVHPRRNDHSIVLDISRYIYRSSTVVCFLSWLRWFNITRKNLQFLFLILLFCLSTYFPCGQMHFMNYWSELRLKMSRSYWRYNGFQRPIVLSTQTHYHFSILIAVIHRLLKSRVAYPLKRKAATMLFSLALKQIFDIFDGCLKQFRWKETRRNPTAKSILIRTFILPNPILLCRRHLWRFLFIRHSHPVYLPLIITTIWPSRSIRGGKTNEMIFITSILD